MSGICGLFNIDGTPASEQDLGAMTAMLGRRGPDQSATRLYGHVGLGHTLLATTPEALLDSQPFTHAESGCSISADARLDYREELLDALALPNWSAAVGDAELILRSYLKWGEQCVQKFYGDFAFVIWDLRENKMFGARDRFGVRPFYYACEGQSWFAFASDARAVFGNQRVPYAINDGRVADYLVPQLEWIDYTSSFFRDVLRLPPAHTVTVTSSGTRTDAYWTPSPGPKLGPMSDEDYEEAFLDVFPSAIQQRLRTASGPIGSMLSGGMDSGSIAAIANELLTDQSKDPLRTYSSARSRNADCLESRRIYASIDMLQSNATVLLPSAAEFDDRLLSSLEEPYDGGFLFMKAIYLAANEQGVNAVLDGAAGDILLYETSYVTRLIREGNVRLALREMSSLPKFWGESSLASETYSQLRTLLVPEFVKQLTHPMRHRRGSRSFVKESMISTGFAEHVDIEARCDRLRETFPRHASLSLAEERARAILPNLTAGRERYARLAASAAVEARDPFLDRRVVDFCTQLPGDQCLRNGWPKYLLRQVTAGKLPEEVRWGRGKPHIGWIYNHEFLQRERQRGRLSLSGIQDTIADYVKPEALLRAWQEFDTDKDSEDLHMAYVLSNWLQQSVTRPMA